MLDQNVLRSLLTHDTYKNMQGQLKASLFAEDAAGLYEALCFAHDKYGHDLTPDELYLAWRQINPVATRANRDEIAALVDDLRGAAPISPDMTQDAVTALWRRDLGKQIATLGLAMAEGNPDVMADIKDLIDKHAEGFRADDFGPPTTLDLVELLKDTGDENRFMFNIATLRQHVNGIGRQEFGVIFATPNTGKTSFLMSICCGPGGFTDQGRTVAYLGNEEATKRTAVRSYCAVTGKTRDELREDPINNRRIYDEMVQTRMIFTDTQDWDLAKMEVYIGRVKPDIVVIDQADKVQISGRYDTGHERLRELYRRLREVAKRHDCAVIGVSQASTEATHRTRIDYSMMEGSKIGKAAEADLIIGIGRQSSDEDNTRYLTVSKNKLTGWHGTIACQIQPEICRYVE